MGEGEAAAVEPAGQTTVSEPSAPEGAPAAPQAPEPAQPSPQGEGDEVFYDASKVRPELRPSFQEMQAAWTKKLEELSPYRKLAEEFAEDFEGGAEEMREFLSQLKDPGGALRYWANLTREYGRDNAMRFMERLFADEQQTQTNQPDPNRPMTLGEFQAWQAHQQRQQQVATEDQEVQTALQDLGIAENREARGMVIGLAQLNQPEAERKGLSLSDQLKAAHETYQKALKGHAASISEVEEANRQATPGSLGGGPAVSQSEPPKDFKEARRQAAQMYAAGDKAKTPND